MKSSGPSEFYVTDIQSIKQKMEECVDNGDYV